MLHSLIYISESTVSIPAQEWEIEDIIKVSRRRNRLLNVTGALMLTQSNFVQVLEGAPPALDELMVSIRDDRRHRNVRVLEREILMSRRFATWSMAYVGPAALVESKLAPLVDRTDSQIDPFAIEDMIMLLRALVSLGQ